MANVITIKRSSTASAVPTAGQLAVGELAVNLADKKLYTKNGGGTVITLAQPTSGTNAQLLANDGSGGFANVTVGTNLTLSGGTLSASGGSGGTQSRSLIHEYPSTSDVKVPFFYTTASMTLTKIMAVCPGGTTPSISYNVRYASDMSAAGTTVTSTANTVTSITTGNAVTSFSNAVIPAGSFVWLEVTAVAGGTAPIMLITLEF